MLSSKEASFELQLKKLQDDFEDISGRGAIDMQRVRTLESLLNALVVNISYSAGVKSEVGRPNHLLTQCRLLGRQLEACKAKSVQSAVTVKSTQLPVQPVSSVSEEDLEEFTSRLDKTQVQLQRLAALLTQATEEAANYKSQNVELLARLSSQEQFSQKQEVFTEESKARERLLMEQIQKLQSELGDLERKNSGYSEERREFEMKIQTLEDVQEQLKLTFTHEMEASKARFDEEMEQAKIRWDRETKKLCELHPCYLDLKKRLEIESDVSADLRRKLADEVRNSLVLGEEIDQLRRRMTHLTNEIAAKVADVNTLELALVSGIQVQSQKQVELDEIKHDQSAAIEALKAALKEMHEENTVLRQYSPVHHSTSPAHRSATPMADQAQFESLREQK